MHSDIHTQLAQEHGSPTCRLTTTKYGRRRPLSRYKIEGVCRQQRAVITIPHNTSQTRDYRSYTIIKLVPNFSTRDDYDKEEVRNSAAKKRNCRNSPFAFIDASFQSSLFLFYKETNVRKNPCCFYENWLPFGSCLPLCLIVSSLCLHHPPFRKPLSDSIFLPFLPPFCHLSKP